MVHECKTEFVCITGASDNSLITVHRDDSLGGGQSPSEDVEERGLPGSVGAHKSMDLAPPELHRDTAQGLYGPERLAHCVRLDEGRIDIGVRLGMFGFGCSSGGHGPIPRGCQFRKLGLSLRNWSMFSFVRTVFSAGTPLASLDVR